MTSEHMQRAERRLRQFTEAKKGSPYRLGIALVNIFGGNSDAIVKARLFVLLKTKDRHLDDIISNVMVGIDSQGAIRAIGYYP